MTERPIALAVVPADAGVSVRPVFLTLFMLVVAASLWLSLSDHLPTLVTRAVQGRQELAHVAMHACLAAIASLAFPNRMYRTLAALLAFAVVVELAQATTLTRQVSVGDLAANLLGTIFGSGLWLALRGLADPRLRDAAVRRNQ